MLNISFFLTRAACQFADAPATIYGNAIQTYSDLNTRVGRLAAALKAQGVKRQERVGVICDPEPRALECLFAPIRAGAVLVPMNPKLHPTEHAYMLNDVGARVLICGRKYLEGILSVREQLPSDLIIVGMDLNEETDIGAIDYERLIEGSKEALDDCEIADDDNAWIFYTSGTTGRPKGAILTQRNLLTMINNQLISVCYVSPGDRVGYLAPISHGAGLWSFQHVVQGATHVFPTTKGFRPQEFYRFVSQHKVSNCFMAPTMIQRLVDDPPKEEDDVSSLQKVLYGGGPMYVDCIESAVQIFGKIFIQVYALGECPMGITSLPRDEHDLHDPNAKVRLGSAGRGCHSVQLQIIDKAGNEVPPGERGQLTVRGELVMKGYWNNKEATEETIRNGWLRTGDVGYLDERGYFFVTDREKDMIITGGANVYPREVEEVIYKHKAVREAVVFGLPDSHWGEKIIAAVVPQDGLVLTEEEVINWCRSHLASFKKPSEVHFTDDLQTNNYGKVLRREIRDKFLKELPTDT